MCKAHLLTSVAFWTRWSWCLQTGHTVTLSNRKKLSEWWYWGSDLCKITYTASICVLTSTYDKCFCEDKTKNRKRHVSRFLFTSMSFFMLVRYHRLDDAVNGLGVYDGSALAQVHRHEVPPEDHPRGVGDLPHSHLIDVLGSCHGKYTDTLVPRPLCWHFDAPTWVPGHMAVCDYHSESEGLGVRGWAQHFLGHVHEGTVDVGALAQVLDSIDTL